MRVFLRPINPVDIKTLSLTYPGALLAGLSGLCSGTCPNILKVTLCSRAGKDNLTFPAVLGGEVR